MALLRGFVHLVEDGAAANGGIASLFQLTRLVAAVADHLRKARRLRVLWRTGCNRPCAIYFAFLVWDSVRARHTAIAETAVRPSQGRRSRNVMTMVALS
jgi:hypothetical protein